MCGCAEAEVTGDKSPPPSKPPKGGSKAKCFAYAAGGGTSGGDTTAEAGAISMLLERHLLCVIEAQTQDIRKIFCDATLQEGIKCTLPRCQHRSVARMW
jgi:hypothetical protein